MPDAEGAIERLYEDADVRDELRDDEANLLLKWAEDQLTKLAEQSATDDEFAAKADQFRGLLKGMNRLVGNRTTLDAAALDANLAQLSTQATSVATSGQVSAQVAASTVPDAELKTVAGKLPALDDAGAVNALMALFTPGAVQAQTAAPAPVPHSSHEAMHETKHAANPPPPAAQPAMSVPQVAADVKLPIETPTPLVAPETKTDTRLKQLCRNHKLARPPRRRKHPLSRAKITCSTVYRSIYGRPGRRIHRNDQAQQHEIVADDPCGSDRHHRCYRRRRAFASDRAGRQQPRLNPSTQHATVVITVTPLAGATLPSVGTSVASVPNGLTILSVPQGFGAQRSFWRVYFDQPSSSDKSTYTAGIDTALVTDLNAVQRTIDIAAYEFNDPLITKAVLDAHTRGVQVRVVTDDNDGLGDASTTLHQLVNVGIPVVTDGRSALMHDKFMILDSTVVWTGTWNYTVNDTYSNNNNALVLRAQKVVSDYQAEFNEMFVDHQFGPTSPANTLYKTFTQDGIPMQVYFAPEDKRSRPCWLQSAERRTKFVL